MILVVKNYLFIMVLFGAGWAAAWWGSGRELRRLMGPRLLAEFGITTFAGFFAPNIWVYHVVTIGAFVATVRNREDAICRYAVMIGLLPGVITSLASGSVFFGAYQGTVPLSFAMLLAGAMLPDSDRAARPLRGWRVEDSFVAVVFLIFSLGATHLQSATVILRSFATAATDLLLPYWLFRRYVRSVVELHRLLACFAFSAIPIALIAIYEARGGWPLFAGIVTHISMFGGLSASLARRGNALRAQVAFSTPLVLALFFLLALPAWLCVRRFFVNQTAWLAGAGLLLVATIAPQSRGVLLALVPALIVLLVTRRRFAAAAGLLAAAGMGGAALLVLQHSSAAVSAFIGGNQSGEYFDYRELLFHRGMQEGMKHWLVGQSFAATYDALRDITQGEHIVDFVNTYLTMFLLSGVVGLVPFILCCGAVLRRLIARAPRDATLQAVRDMRAYLLSALSGFLIFIWSMSFVERVETYLMLLLAMARLCSAKMIRTDVRTRPVPSGERPENSLPARILVEA